MGRPFPQPFKDCAFIKKDLAAKSDNTLLEAVGFAIEEKVADSAWRSPVMLTAEL
ncbi:MAG TPA: hypothetical protein PKY01_09945 [Candidatus Hydrogenedentes bacterium]|nr:hypothetical protein [Candidatus Hydrogenedentota bacterium]